LIVKLCIQHDTVARQIADACYFRTRQASGDVSDDSALESDVSSLVDSEDGRRSPTPTWRRRGNTRGSPRGSAAAARRDVTRRRGGRRTAAPRRDRMLLREWLQTQADRGGTAVDWCNRERTMIRIPWKHGSRSGWTIDDCRLYRAWALYTGTYIGPAPILSVFFALIVHSELKSVHPGFPVAFIFLSTS